MDLVTSCKEKLIYFRIKELKDVLNKLGLSKQGKKQDLVDRILATISDEQVSGMWAKKNIVVKEGIAKLVEDTYRKMQGSGANDLASLEKGVSDSIDLKLKEEIVDSYKMGKVRCPCGSSLQTDTVVKCEDPSCNVWQHIGCVIVPEKAMEGVPTLLPESFYCEICRLSRADPFWVTVTHPLYPVKLTVTSVPTNGANPVQCVEKTFQLTRADKDLLAKKEFDVQVWCILLNDKVPFRMQWPQHADLQVNGVPVRATNRPGSQLLGANGRDDGHVITSCTRDGVNKISLTACDARIFCIGVRIVKRRTIQQILSLIPKESDGEPFEDAVARVRRCVGGGTATENADSDSDLEVVADSISVNLRCPMSGSRMKIAGRFKPCVHMGCFDLEVFVEMNQRSRKWQCPICLKNYSLETVIIDPYFNRITSKLRNCGEDVTEIEVKPDGSWRAKAENDCMSLGNSGQWHLPDGTPYVPTEKESNPTPEVYKQQIKQEVISDGHTGLKLEIKRNHDGLWEVSKHEDIQAQSYGNRLQEGFTNPFQNFIPMSRTATGSGRECEDPSVNRDAGGNIAFLINSEIDLDSVSLNIDTTKGLNDSNPTAPLGDAGVIVLSDSEENETFFPSGNIFKNNQTNAGLIFPVLQNGISDSYHEDPGLGIGVSSCLDLFENNDDEFGMQMWSLPSGSQADFQLFGSNANVSDLGDMHGSLCCPTLTNGYNLTGETTIGTAVLPDSSFGHTNARANDGLVENPLAFGEDDPPLQIFFPTRPSDASAVVDLRNQPEKSNGLPTEDWLPLRLGSGGSVNHQDPAAANGLNSREQLLSWDSAFDSLADTASLLASMNENKPVKANRERLDIPFSFPCEQRSVRPRVYLSFDSDSE